MSYLCVGVCSGNVPVYHGTDNSKDIGRNVRLTELILRCLVFVLALVSALLIATDSQVQEIFTIQKKAKFTDMKSLVFLVVVNAIAAAYSLVQLLRCGLSVVTRSVVMSKPLAWLILSGDQLMAYMMLAAFGAALQSAIFAKFAEPELQWMKVCGMYAKFCNRSGEGLACSAVAWLMMVIVTGISSFSLFRLYGGNKGTKTVGGW